MECGSVKSVFGQTVEAERHERGISNERQKSLFFSLSFHYLCLVLVNDLDRNFRIVKESPKAKSGNFYSHSGSRRSRDSGSQRNFSSNSSSNSSSNGLRQWAWPVDGSRTRKPGKAKVGEMVKVVLMVMVVVEMAKVVVDTPCVRYGNICVASLIIDEAGEDDEYNRRRMLIPPWN